MTTRTLSRLAFALAAAAPLTTAGCGKDQHEVVAADTGANLDLEKRLKALETERDAAKQATSAAGLVGETQGQTIIRLAERVKSLEERLASATPGGAGAGMDSAAGGSIVGSTASGTPLLSPATPDGTFSEEQISTFRKLADEVQKRKDLEQQAERVKAALARAGVTLPADQEAALVKLQQGYQDKIRELFRTGFGQTDDERKQRTAQVEQIRTQFETDLRAIVPATDADKIVESMSRGFPGMLPGRMGGGGSTRRSGGGMGG